MCTTLLSIINNSFVLSHISFKIVSTSNCLLSSFSMHASKSSAITAQDRQERQSKVGPSVGLFFDQPSSQRSPRPTRFHYRSVLMRRGVFSKQVPTRRECTRACTCVRDASCRTRMRERRQATGFIGGPETEIKNVPENQNCPQDVPLPQRIV